MANELWMKEYYTLVDIVKDYDQRQFLVKGWGVTLSLAALSLGFQSGHFGMFLVACVSGAGFWILEGILKQFQMRYYYRMREIEVVNYERASEREEGSRTSTPLIDWSWSKAKQFYLGRETGVPPPPRRYGKFKGYSYPWLGALVALPHVISVAVGGTLFFLGLLGVLGEAWKL